MRKGKKWLITFLILIILLGAGYFLSSEFLQVEEIKVSGNREIDAQKIIQLSGVEKGQNALLLNRGKVRENLESNPYLKVVDVKYVFPTTIELVVEEREEYANILFTDTFITIDAEKHILAVTKQKSQIQVPCVIGLTPNSFDVGKEMVCEDTVRLDLMTEILNELELYEMKGNISEINLESISNITMLTYEGMTIKMGNGEMIEDKIAWINEVLPFLLEKGYEKGILDVSTGKDATYRQEAS